MKKLLGKKKVQAEKAQEEKPGSSIQKPEEFKNTLKNDMDKIAFGTFPSNDAAAKFINENGVKPIFINNYNARVVVWYYMQPETSNQ